MDRKPALSAIVRQWTEEFPDLSYDGVKLMCKVCNIELSCKLKGRIKRHVESKTHITLRDGDKQRQFNIDLLKFMVGCNISWKQLDNPMFRELIEKCTLGGYGEVQLPGCTTLRQTYLPQVADDTVASIRSELEDKYIWVSVDETITAAGSKIANVFVGALEEECGTREHLFASKSFDEVNAETVATLVNDSLRLLWRDDYAVKNDKFLLFVTDGAPYMTTASRILQVQYNFLHATCFVQDLHQVAEAVRECYPKVDRLISSVNKVFKKHPERVQLFCELHPDIELPPEPVSTRWAMWIDAAAYYFMNLEKIKQVLQQLDAKEAAIVNAEEILMDPIVKNNLQEIFNSYSRIPEAVRKLEQRPQTGKFSLTEQINVIYDLRHHMAFLQVESATRVRQKLDQVLENNPGFRTLSGINQLLQKQEVDFSMPGLHEASLYKHSFFRYAPVTSVDMERSFSPFKWIFSDRRRRLTPAHIEHILMISWFYISASSAECVK